MNLTFDAEMKAIGLLCNAPALVTRPFLFEPGATIGSRPTNGLVFVGAHVKLGRKSYVNDGFLRPNTTIGRYCSIGRRVTIGAPDHRVDRLSTHPVASGRPVPVRASQRDVGSKPRAPIRTETIIGNDVWIGDGVVIMEGLVIGDGAVIGANAVVTKDVPPYAIVGGVPAKLIRSRFSDEVIAELLANPWWELADELVTKLPMSDVGTSLDMTRELRKTFGVSDVVYTTIP